jgi:RNA polymerase sigma factor (sigma-70 family)
MDHEELNYQKLPDQDLVQRFCANPTDQDAFTELWKRYEQTARKYAKHLTNMCPHSYNRDIFVEEVFSITQEKVVRKIGGFKATARFSTWLYRIAERTAIEVRRKRLGRSKKGFYVHVPVTDEELSDDSAVFRDKVKRDPFHAALRCELKTMVKSVLNDYVGTKEGFESLTVVNLYAIDDCPVREIAAQRGTYEKKIYRTLEHDYEQLEASFTRAGIKSLLEP